MSLLFSCVIRRWYYDELLQAPRKKSKHRLISMNAKCMCTLFEGIACYNEYVLFIHQLLFIIIHEKLQYDCMVYKKW